VFVEPTLRRNGLASKFYERLLEDCSPNAPLTCEISINPQNLDSFKFHDKIGFKEIGIYSAHENHPCSMQSFL